LTGFRPTKDQPLEEPALWLNAQRTLDLANSVSEVEVLRELCASVVENQAKAQHHLVMRHRRMLMYIQLTLLLIGMLVLIPALLGLQFVD
jgi:hypothetical protein